MFGYTVIKENDLKSLRSSKKALQEQVFRVINELNEYKLRYSIAKAELEKWKPARDEKGKFTKKQVI